MPESSIVVRPDSPDNPTYTASARLQAAGLQSAIELFVAAAAEVAVPRPPQPIVIADYGASTAHNSLLPVCAAIAALRRRTPKEQPILVAHTDTADNDFTAMFNTVVNDPDSYLHKDCAVYASAVGRSFYTQILPSYSVNLGWSSWAIQWLSRSPAIGDHIVPAFSRDTAVAAECARQAAYDWHEFIAYRGRELAPEGRLVVLTMGLDESGEFGLRPLVHTLYAVLQELVGAGVITAAELAAMSIPLVGRTAKDFEAPFAPKDSIEGLSIELIEVSDAEDRFWQRYQADQDAKTFGAQWAALLRASVFDTLATALAGGATDPRAAEFADRLQRGVSERLAAAPEQMRIPLAKVVLRKKPGTSG